MKQMLLVGLILLSLPSCSVYKASSNDGVSISDIEQCKTKYSLLAHGMKLIKTGKTNGKRVEVYRAIARKSESNYMRAVGHGVLDLATLGIWEVAGTPIEQSIDNNRGFIIAKVTYSHGDDIENIEIYNGALN
ncbi:hypothetical protein FACS189472_04820 [Alphaproteobacteria bacterium]|nr:hypothetical protein FACS189472_04820 [Alphaproteobacteria bacterium]